MYVKAFKVNVNKCLKPFFLEQHINIVNTVTLQSFLYISILYDKFGCYKNKQRVKFFNKTAYLSLFNSTLVLRMRPSKPVRKLSY